MNTAECTAELELMIRSRYSHIWLETWEEERAFSIVKAVARRLKKKVYTWNVCRGFEPEIQAVADATNGIEALEHIRHSQESAIYLLQDFHPYIAENNPKTIRALRDTAWEIRRSAKSMIFVSPRAALPPELEKSAYLLPLSLPDRDELLQLLDGIIDSVKNNRQLTLDIDDDLRDAMVNAARGLTLAEAESLFVKAAVSDRRLEPGDLGMIIREKKQVLRKTGLLEYFETDKTMGDVGGLDRLKSWLGGRSNAFSEKARSFGLPQPKGLLLLGVQGCGKSLVAKSVAHLWQVPLLRLDMGTLFSSYIGSTEANMRKAINLAESIAPVVLWIDEIEKGLSGLQSSGSVDGGVTARVFGSFLSWMQEKTAPVFVVATSNDVSKLPPELLRKGRFDEIFFVDLPEHTERQEIIAIHISRKKRDPGSFDLAALAEASRGFSGAEIEQAVISALYDAFAEAAELQQRHIMSALTATVPLSVTMAEGVTQLRTWAAERAVPAS